VKEPNEVLISDPTAFDRYLQDSLNLFNDETQMFIIISSASATAVPTVVQLSAEIKIRWYKTSGEELISYVINNADLDMPSLPPLPRPSSFSLSALNINKKDKAFASPPSSIKIYLSRIDLPDLVPKSHIKNITLRSVINFDEPSFNGVGGANQAKGNTTQVEKAGEKESDKQKLRLIDKLRRSQ
jgi:hypothetical protein